MAGRAPRGGEAHGRAAQPLTIRASDRVLIVGMSGGGKSRLATAIARRWDRVLVYDPKDDDEAVLPNSTVATNVRDALRALPGRVIYRPSRAEMADIVEHFDRLVSKVFDRGSHAIVVHELADLADGNRVGPGLSQAIRQGRSRSVPIVLVSQRPVDIPRIAITEARHAFAFHLVDPRDRAIVAGWMGAGVREPIPFDYSFWYRSPEMRLLRCSPLR